MILKWLQGEQACFLHKIQIITVFFAKLRQNYNLPKTMQIFILLKKQKYSLIEVSNNYVTICSIICYQCIGILLDRITKGIYRELLSLVYKITDKE